MQPKGRGIGLVGGALAAVLIVLFIGGCARGARANTAYAQGKYESALVAARHDASRTTGARRDRAGLTAGLSAHALGRYEEATIWLEPLTANGNPEIAGRARATLGLIARDRGQDAEASRLLAEAAGMMQGADADKAAALSGRSHLSARREAGAGGVVDRDTRRSLQSVYTVQVGAFSSRVNAEQAATDFRTRAAGAGFGSPRIAPTTDGRGSLLYLVQIGQFADKREAEAAVGSLGSGIVRLAQAF